MRLKRRLKRLSRICQEVKYFLKQCVASASANLSGFADRVRLAQLVQSRQMGARAAFTEIQTRHQDLRKIEETIAELGQMMQDVSLVIAVTRTLTHVV